MKYITLTKGAVAKVCDCHYDLVKDYKWHLSSGGYAGRKVQVVLCPCGCKGSKHLGMHRVINGTPDGMLTDHINRDRLDNRCENLRSATASENLRNKGGYGRSPFKGVTRIKWRADYGKPETWKSWKAYVGSGKSRVDLGLYATPEEASAAVQEYFTKNG